KIRGGTRFMLITLGNRFAPSNREICNRRYTLVACKANDGLLRCRAAKLVPVRPATAPSSGFPQHQIVRAKVSASAIDHGRCGSANAVSALPDGTSRYCRP